MRKQRQVMGQPAVSPVSSPTTGSRYYRPDVRMGSRAGWAEATLVSCCPVAPPRQLEAIVRIAEALSKMKLQPFATEADVGEALRLFQVSTLDAALSGTLSGG